MKIKKRSRLLYPCFIALLLIQSAPILAECLAFVHLGNQLPSYIFLALAQARLFNKATPIYLLANQEALRSNHTKLNKLNIHSVVINQLSRTQEHEEFLQHMQTKKGMRSGFWLYTSERFLVLYDWMQQAHIQEVVHMENDTLLYANISEFLPIFKNHYPNIAAVFDDDDRCIPCFMYIADGSSMQLLAQFFVHEIASKTPQAEWDINDMQTIARFKKFYGAPTVGSLPIIMPSYITQFGLSNALGNHPARPQDYCNNIEHFNSIFDGAAIGQYLGGTFHGDKPGFINETCIFNPSRLHYEWKVDQEGRKIPYVHFGNERYRLNTLHVHSKKLEQFVS